jgi:hypothetical protein
VLEVLLVLLHHVIHHGAHAAKPRPKPHAAAGEEGIVAEWISKRVKVSATRTAAMMAMVTAVATAVPTMVLMGVTAVVTVVTVMEVAHGGCVHGLRLSKEVLKNIKSIRLVEATSATSPGLGSAEAKAGKWIVVGSATCRSKSSLRAPRVIGSSLIRVTKGGIRLPNLLKLLCSSVLVFCFVLILQNNASQAMRSGTFTVRYILQENRATHRMPL